MDQLAPALSGKPVIIVLSAGGLNLARKIAADLDADIHGHATRCPDANVTFVKARPYIGEMFATGRPIIGICAAGILIRAVAPYLRHKSHDAAVLAVAETGEHVVPLIGGHHGAITLASRVSKIIGASLAVTTAGNLHWHASLDEPPAGWRLANNAAAGPVMAQLLAGDGAFLDGECIGDLQEWLADVPRGNAVTLTATRRAITPLGSHLVYCPQEMVLGVGCARGCSTDELIDLVMRALTEADINAATIACVVSVDLKADEPAILALAEMLKVPFRVFDVAALEAETPRLVNPSETVFTEIGCHGVSEAAALAAAGPKGELVIPKQKSANATMALARKPASGWHQLPGRKPGRVMLIGIGPGQADWRTPEASRLIQSANELVGTLDEP